MVIDDWNVVSSSSAEWFKVFSISLGSILCAIGFAYIVMFFARCGAKSKKYEEYDQQ